MVKRLLVAATALFMAAAVAFALIAPDQAPETDAQRRVAVETAPVEHGRLVARQRLPGSLEPSAQFTVAPKVAGRVQAVLVDLGDRVRRGDVVARLDDDEFRQAVAQAEAELAVTEARLREAHSAQNLAERRLKRVRRLHKQGIASASELDNTRAEAESQLAATAVAEAQIAQAQAALESAQVRLGYTRITADWPGDDEVRLVGERLVDTGDTVAANTPLLTIIAVRRLQAVIQVPEALYAGLAVGQTAQVSAPAVPGRRFEAEIARIAPRFEAASRQARVELTVANPDRILAPGMFVQVSLESGQSEAAPIVPAAAVVERQGETGVFVVAKDSDTARFVPVEIDLRTPERVALRRPASLPGEVVVLGQNQLEDGAAIIRAGQAS